MTTLLEAARAVVAEARAAMAAAAEGPAGRSSRSGTANVSRALAALMQAVDELPETTQARRAGPRTQCPRCGEVHDPGPFVRFARPIVDPDGTTWTHWHQCVRTGDPILVQGLDAGGARAIEAALSVPGAPAVVEAFRRMVDRYEDESRAKVIEWAGTHEWEHAADLWAEAQAADLARELAELAGNWWERITRHPDDDADPAAAAGIDLEGPAGA